MTRARWTLTALFVLLVAGLGHLGWWYLPRERAARPSVDLALPLLEDERYPLRLWIPYPHQNLVAWQRGAGLDEEWLAAVGRLAGVQVDSNTVRIPGYGPFRLPPSSEIVAAWSDESSLSIAARVYPIWAAIGRMAGAVARNPWLAGGQVEVGGRSATVSWRGRIWSVTVGEAGTPASGASPGLAERGLLAVGLSAPDLPPTGVSTLRRTAQGLELSGGDGAAADVELALEDGWRVLGEGDVLLVGAPGRAALAPSALLLEGGGIRAGVVSLPGALAVTPAGSERWELPAEGLARRLGLSPREQAVDGWQLVAYDTATISRAEASLAGFAALLGETGPSLAFWLRPDQLHSVAQGLASALERLPLVPSEEARRWRDIERALRPLAGRERLACVFGSDGGLVLRFEGRARIDSPP